jgi:hypothetical protein
MKFSELAERWGSAQQIPNDQLYTYIQDHREDIVNEARLGVERIPGCPMGREVRRRCKADIMWMARYFTWETNPASENGFIPFSENIFDDEFYGVFSELFIKKDDTKPIREQSDIKTRLLLWPRGGAKSTFDHVDTVQWILNFPSIRILYLTAEVTLAEGFVGEIKGHFYFKETPTLMNLFYPEYCVEENKAGASDTFVCPVYAAKKTGRKEPTVYASSVGKNKAGWRYELIKADDAVSDVNSESSLQCEKISNHLFLAEKLLALGINSGFYVDYIGTRYADEDHYGVLLEQNTGDITTTQGTGWVLMENHTTKTKILIGRAMQIKPEVIQKLEQEGKAVNYKEAGSEGVILLMPHLMSYEWCMADFAKNEKAFEGQRNQNPRPASTITFTRDLLLRSTIPYTQMPTVGVVSQVWDFAFSKAKGRDYSTGCSIMWVEEAILDEFGKKTDKTKIVGYVQEIVRDRFDHLKLANAVVSLAEKYKPYILGIENAGGAMFLTEQIKMEAIRKNNPDLVARCSNIDWFTPDNQKDAKKVRMASIYPWLVQERMKFLNGCFINPKTAQPDMELIYNEFEQCLTNHKRDDVPDVIGMQLRYAPRVTIAIIENTQEAKTSMDDIWHNLIFEEGTDAYGRIGFAVPTPVPLIQEIEPDYEVSPQTINGLPNVLGAGICG